MSQVGYGERKTGRKSEIINVSGMPNIPRGDATKQYRLDNPEKARGADHIRRARKRNAYIAPVTAANIARMMAPARPVPLLPNGAGYTLTTMSRSQREARTNRPTCR